MCKPEAGLRGSLRMGSEWEEGGFSILSITVKMSPTHAFPDRARPLPGPGEARPWPPGAPRPPSLPSLASAEGFYVVPSPRSVGGRLLGSCGGARGPRRLVGKALEPDFLQKCPQVLPEPLVPRRLRVSVTLSASAFS